MLSQYYLGLYRTSMGTVGQITSIITAATTPVLFSSLSRLQNSRGEFNSMFFKFQKLVSLLVMPIGVGIFIFSKLITEILLGKQWLEASSFIGIWGLTSAITIVLAHYASEVYRSIGKPKLSVLSQWLHIVVLCPVLLIFVQKGYSALCLSRAIVRLELVLVQLLLMGFVVKMSVWKMIKNILPSSLAASAMLLILLLPSSGNFFQQFLYILICICIYFMVIQLFPEERKLCLNLKTIIKR